MTPDEIKAAAREAVADWPDDYSPERKAELRRILLGSSTAAGGRPVDTRTTSSTRKTA